MITNGVWFIIVAYKADKNALKLLISALKDFHVIVISNDNTAYRDVVPGDYKEIKNSINMGYGGGANVGMRYALSRKAKWLVVLNQDLVLSFKSAKDFATKLTKSPSCVAGPFAGGLDRRRWTTRLPSRQTDYITGSCFAIHRKVIETVGYFYEPYFLYYEEVDYCVRARLLGFPIKHLHLRDISHNETETLGQGSFLHQYYLSRNHLLFVWRLAPAPVKLYELFRSTKTVSEHIVRHEKGALKGIKDFLFGRFGEYAGRGL
ncbi:glycosyltransferase family 2 protein [Patescibacteria group bacterium]|nr:glycosyltransferase family 2 protein [Patescibacteria group bacterium]MBU1472816.1 glycosyltransferase family 2 protein [Patescibacteria group bacterium]MBU2460376.1 glycosyltransferase family 2 protein [Patescibacteria group bacterium]MBU2544046.1 glycosyltransferase family 2 protein [Patescibacteria group bacterium]